MGALQPWHWIIVAIALLVLFGSKKLPDAARGLGRSMRIFKAEVREMQNEGKESAEQQPAITQPENAQSTASEATQSSDSADVAQRKSA